MLLGASLGLGSALAFGVNSVFTRRGVLRASANYIATISILTGPLFFSVAAALAGELPNLGQFSWKAYLFFALSGLIHFALGRSFAYRSVQLIGATRSNIVTGANAIVSVILAIVVLREVLTVPAGLGIALSMSGPLVMAWKERTVTSSARTKANPHGRDVDRHSLYLGLLFGLGASLFWGSSAIFIKLALDNGGSPLAGSLIAYATASLVISPSFFSRPTRQELLGSDRGALRLALLSGCSTNIAQLLRYVALAHTSVIMVSLMMRTIPVWVLVLAFLVNRKHESFSPWVLIGNALLLAGSLLVML